MSRDQRPRRVLRQGVPRGRPDRGPPGRGGGRALPLRARLRRVRRAAAGADRPDLPRRPQGRGDRGPARAQGARQLPGAGARRGGVGPRPASSRTIVDRFVELAAAERSTRSPRCAARSRSTRRRRRAPPRRLSQATGKDVEVKVIVDPDGARRHRRHDRRPRHRRLRPSPARAAARTELLRKSEPDGRADHQRRRDRSRAAQAHRDVHALASTRPRSAGCSRSATASPASPGLPDDLGQRGARVRGRHARPRAEPRRGLDRRGRARRGRATSRRAARSRRPAASSRCPSATRCIGRVVNALGQRDRRQGPDRDDRDPPPRGAGARHRRPPAGARAAADRHQGHRRDDARSAAVSASSSSATARPARPPSRSTRSSPRRARA